MSLPVLTPDAEADIEEAALWYERRAAGLGVDFVARVRDAVSRIAAHPELYPSVHNVVRRARLKRFPYGVFYRIQADRIEVIAVLHDRRNPTVWQQRI
jgi:plasmid stabilization system protein ParE